MGLKIGQLVSSKAGRDTGRKYIVIDTVDDQYVLVADGITRKISRPKKKNIKHLTIHGMADEIMRKLDNRKISNQQLKQIIASYMDMPDGREEVTSDNG